MPARRLLMRKIREILRLRHEQGLSHREIAQACVIGPGTVSRYLQRAVRRGLGWPLPAELDDAALEARLFPRTAPVAGRARPDCFPAPRRWLAGPGPTARTSTASSSATVSPCSCSGRSMSRSIRPATATRSSARSAGNGRGGCVRRCGRCTAPAKRPSSIFPASGRAWSTDARVSCDASSCSSPYSAPAGSPTPRRPRRSSWPIG